MTKALSTSAANLGLIDQENLALKTDSYKVSHWQQFPKGTEYMSYYVEPRIANTDIMVFGTQMLMMKHFMNVPTLGQIEEANELWTMHGLRFNLEGWQYISDLGYLPLEVKAVPEGTVLPSQNVLMTIQNTDPKCFWLPGWMETLTMQLWYPITVATRSYECKKVILKWLEKTGDPAGIGFKLHDFGYRGATSQESAGIYGAAHLVNFMGTDTMAGIVAARKYYNTKAMPAFSIPAAEHSTVISWGYDRESEAYKNMISTFGLKDALVAVVSDSYNLSNAVENIWCKELKQLVIDSGCTLVVRPDSGDPATIVVRTLQQLEKGFGATVNDKGYKVLAPCVRLIQGDGIDKPITIDAILQAVADAGFSADNVAFGMGAGLAQKLDRDTMRFAEKCSAVRIDNVWHDVNKNPSDAPWKASKKGRLTLVIDQDKNYRTININEMRESTHIEVLQTIFKNGELVNPITFEDVRKRATI